MKAKLVIEGKEFPIEILDPELQKLLAPPKKTGHERVELDNTYYCDDYNGPVCNEIEEQHNCDNILYDGANYYSDQTVAENNARADKLMRQLRRFSVEHRENKNDWSDDLTPKYFIRYACGSRKLFIDRAYSNKNFGCIYFNTEEAAQAALDTFYDELIWYFTEYNDSL